MRPVVVLVGPPGSGKTTIGRLVADKLGVGFRDTDTDIEAMAGKPVSDIFVDDGEPRFRELEEQAVTTALEQHDGVLALGGGAVENERVRDRLHAHRVVFLEVGLAAAFERVGLARSRPLLVVNPRAELKRLLAERRPRYEAVAGIVVPTDDRSPEDVTADVIAFVEASA